MKLVLLVCSCFLFSTSKITEKSILKPAFKNHSFSKISNFELNNVESDAIIGIWKHETSESKIQIYKSDNQYFGKVLSAKDAIVNGKLSLDIKNPEPALRKRTVIGLVILSNFSYSGKNVWENGEIYDSRAGKTYSCRLTLQTNQTLIVRGYIKAPLFGKNEVFKRVE